MGDDVHNRNTAATLLLFRAVTESLLQSSLPRDIVYEALKIIGVDDMMLVAAFAAALTSWATGSPLAGVAVAVLIATSVALVQAFLSVTLRANQLVVGIGFNILALGATTFMYREIFGPLSRDPIPGFAQLNLPCSRCRHRARCS